MQKSGAGMIRGGQVLGFQSIQQSSWRTLNPFTRLVVRLRINYLKAAPAKIGFTVNAQVLISGRFERCCKPLRAIWLASCLLS